MANSDIDPQRWLEDRGYAEKLEELALLDHNDPANESRIRTLEAEIVALEGDSLSLDGDGALLGSFDPPNAMGVGQSNAAFQHTTLFPTTLEFRPHSSSAALPTPTGHLSSRHQHANGLDGHFASDNFLMDPDQIPVMPGSWQPNLDRVNEASPGPSATDDNSGHISPPASTPSERSTSIQRKRHRPELSLDEDALRRPHKSRRTTPSPSETSGTTPTSFESVPSGLFDLLGGDPKADLREMRKEQLEQEQRNLERQREIARDEAFALALQAEFEEETPWSGLPSTSSSNIPAGPSSQAMIGADGSLQRSSLPSQSFNEPSLSMAANGLPENMLYAPNNLKDAQSSHQWNRFAPSRSPAASRRPLVKSEVNVAGHGPVDVIDLADDSDDEAPIFAPGHTSANPITLGSDNPTDVDAFAGYAPGPNSSARAHPQPYASNPNYMGAAAQSLAHGASNFGQSVYNNAVDFLGSFNALFEPSSTGHYGYGSILDSTVTPAGYASQTFSRHGMDPSRDAQAYQDYLDRINYVANDPTRTRAEIQSLLENIRPDEDLPKENREGTPEAMTYVLMEHQKLGLAWLKKMELSEQKGGILADAMGLGKTIQALALISSHKSEDPMCKTTLIVAPVALMRQWEKEIRTKLKPGRHALKVCTVHGKTRLQSWEQLRVYDVVLTTFGTLSSEHKRREEIWNKQRANPNWRATAKEDNLPMLGDKSSWYRVIIDEAQCIKNKSTRASNAAAALRAKSRFCMTGTPMMNNVDELYSLIRFLRITPWNDSTEFNKAFSRPLKNQNPRVKDRAMQRLQVLLKAILLRRNKDSKIDDKPILDLPARHTESIHAVFSHDEQEFYRALETRTRLQFNKYLKAGTVGRNYSNILVLLLRLRQACCHPHLLRDFAEKAFPDGVDAHTLVDLAKELAPDAVIRLKEQSQEADSALECPICFDTTPNATIFLPCGHNACSECFARISDPQQAIANGDENGGREGEAKCPNCRGKIMVSKIIDHNTFKQVYMQQNEDKQDEAGSPEDDDGSSESDEDDESEGSDLGGFIVDDDATTTDDDEDSKYRKGSNPFEKASKKLKKSKGKGKDKGKGKEKAVAAPKNRTLAQLKKDSSSSAKARSRYLRRLQKDWETSAKIEKTMAILQNVQDNPNKELNRPEKVIIFSQFTSLLDLLEIPINRAGYNYERYDGSMSPKARNQAVENFTDNKDVQLMLISLKAGNAGLNLVAASQVIIFDPFWNPYIEEQAIDRAHRIGQQFPVHVHRVLVKNTVEDRILALQEKKRDLIESALDEGEARRISRLGVQDLTFLFNGPNE